MPSIKVWSLVFRLLSLVTVYCLLSTSTAHASEFSIVPSIAVSEDYTDNVFETHTDRKTDFITHLSPGLTFMYRAPFWDWDLKYLLDYRYYARNSQGGQFDHYLDTKGNLRIIDNLLFLDVSDTYQKVSLDVNRNTTTDSTFVNQADQNILNVAPHIEFHPGASFLVKSGYHYTKESYMNETTVDNNFSTIDREEHGAILATTYELSPKSTITTNFAYAHVDTGLSNFQANTGQQALSYHQLLPSLGIRYEYAAKSYISLEGGYCWFLFDKGLTNSYPYWNAAIIHAFDHFILSLEANIKYNTDPLRSATEERDYTAKLDKTMNRGSMGLSVGYNELHDDYLNTLISRWYGIRGNIKHELTEKITGHLDLSGEKVNMYDNTNINNDSTLPYRLSIAAGIGYTLANNLTLNLDYSYTTNRQSITSSTNNTETNRVILGLTKSFGKVLEKLKTSDDDKEPGTNDK